MHTQEHAIPDVGAVPGAWPWQERLAYVALRAETSPVREAIGVVELDQGAPDYGQLIWQAELPRKGERPAIDALPVESGDTEPGEVARLVIGGPGKFRVAVLDLRRSARQPTVATVFAAGGEGWYTSRVEIPMLSRPGGNGRDPVQLIGQFLGPRLRVVDAIGGIHRRALGFAGVPVSPKDFSSTIWAWTRNDLSRRWSATPVITLPAEAASAAILPRALRRGGVVPPFVADLRLSADDRYLLVACWGTGALLRYDVSRPLEPRLVGSLRLGGIANRAGHPSRPGRHLSGGPQRIELSADGRRAYVTNGLGSPWDAAFYPDGVRGWMARVELDPAGPMAWDPSFLVEFPDGMLPDQLWLKRPGAPLTPGRQALRRPVFHWASSRLRGNELPGG